MSHAQETTPSSEDKQQKTAAVVPPASGSTLPVSGENVKKEAVQGKASPKVGKAQNTSATPKQAIVPSSGLFSSIGKPVDWSSFNFGTPTGTFVGPREIAEPKLERTVSTSVKKQQPQKQDQAIPINVLERVYFLKKADYTPAAGSLAEVYTTEKTNYHMSDMVFLYGTYENSKVDIMRLTENAKHSENVIEGFDKRVIQDIKKIYKVVLIVKGADASKDKFVVAVLTMHLGNDLMKAIRLLSEGKRVNLKYLDVGLIPRTVALQPYVDTSRKVRPDEARERSFTPVRDEQRGRSPRRHSSASRSPPYGGGGDDPGGSPPASNPPNPPNSPNSRAKKWKDIAEWAESQAMFVAKQDIFALGYLRAQGFTVVEKTAMMNEHSITAGFRWKALQEFVVMMGKGKTKISLLDYYGSTRSVKAFSPPKVTGLEVDWELAPDTAFAGDMARESNRVAFSGTMYEGCLIMDVYHRGVDQKTGLDASTVKNLCDKTTSGIVIGVFHTFPGYAGADVFSYGGDTKTEGVWTKDEKNMINFSPDARQSSYPIHPDPTEWMIQKHVNGLDIHYINTFGPYAMYKFVKAKEHAHPVSDVRATTPVVDCIYINETLAQKATLRADTAYNECVQALRETLPESLAFWLPPEKKTRLMVHMESYNALLLAYSLRAAAGMSYDSALREIQARLEKDSVMRAIQKRQANMYRNVLHGTLTAVMFSQKHGIVEDFAKNRKTMESAEAQLLLLRQNKEQPAAPFKWLKVLLVIFGVVGVFYLIRRMKRPASAIPIASEFFNWIYEKLRQLVVKLGLVKQNVREKAVAIADKISTACDDDVKEMKQICVEKYDTLTMKLTYMGRYIYTALNEARHGVLTTKVEQIRAMERLDPTMTLEQKRDVLCKMMTWKEMLLNGFLTVLCTPVVEEMIKVKYPSLAMIYFPVEILAHCALGNIGVGVQIALAHTLFYATGQILGLPWAIATHFAWNAYATYVAPNSESRLRKMLSTDGQMLDRVLHPACFAWALWQLTKPPRDDVSVWEEFKHTYDQGKFPEDKTPKVQIIPKGDVLLPKESENWPEECHRGEIKVYFYQSEVSLSQAKEILWREEQIAKVCIYPILINNALMHVPNNSIGNLLSALVQRIHKDPFKDCPPIQARLLHWQSLFDLLREAGFYDTLKASMMSNYMEFPTIQQACRIMGSRGDRLLRSHTAMEEGRPPSFKKSYNVKWNETICWRADVNDIKPRAICNLDPDVHALTTQWARYISDCMHHIFDGSQSFKLPGVGDIYIVYASGKTQSELNEVYHMINSYPNIIVVAGDDSVFKISLAGSVRIYEGDLTMYDQSQDEGPNRVAFRQWMAAIRVPSDIIDFFYRSFADPYKIKKQNKWTIVGQAGVQLPTGSTITTALNSMNNIEMILWIMLRISQTGVWELGRYAAELGFTLKQREHATPEVVTFLKGWWVPCIKNNQYDHCWMPLPSAVVKLGKMLRDPRELCGKIDPYAFVSTMISRSYQLIPRQYPILGYLLQTFDRFSISDLPTYSRAHEIIENFEFKTKIDEQVYFMDSRCLQMTYDMIGSRYGISPDEIHEIRTLYNMVTELPTYMQHTVFEKLCLADYA